MTKFFDTQLERDELFAVAFFTLVVIEFYVGWTSNTPQAQIHAILDMFYTSLPVIFFVYAIIAKKSNSTYGEWMRKSVLAYAVTSIVLVLIKPESAYGTNTDKFSSALHFSLFPIASASLAVLPYMYLI